MRSDQTAICTACACRFSRELDACPTCGGQARDLREATSQSIALLTLSSNQRSAMLREAYDWDRSLVVGQLPRAFTTVVLIALSLYLADKVHLAFFLGLPAAMLYFALGDGVRQLGKWLQQRRLRRLAAPCGVHVAPPALPGPATEVRGRVQLLEPVIAPLSATPCAAFRIAGRDDRDNAIDDAGLGAFEVVAAGGARARIAGEAAIAIDVGAPGRVRRPSAALRRFLGDRGVAPDARLWLAEALLLDGDEVVVCGEAEDVAEPAGYRDSSWTRVFRGAVVIRGASLALSSSASR